MFKRIVVIAVAMVSCAHAQIPSIPAKGVLPDMMAAQMPRGQAHPASVWKIAEKTRYRELLAKGTFDVLVVPFQVQFYGFGRSTRSLMTAQLALAVAADGARRVPDPYLVARALGDGERRVHPEEVFRLADELRVKTIVWGYVGHSNFGKLFLSLQRQDRMESGAFDRNLDLPLTLRQFTNIAFSPETPPEEIFRGLLPEVLKSLGIDAGPSAKPVSKLAVAALPASPFALADGGSDPARNAYFLQLLAALAPASADRAKERYAEKSWLAAHAMAPESASYNYARARAWLMLGHRAAALKALGTPRAAEEKHLLAALNGDLPEMRRLAPGIKGAAAALLARLDENTVAVHYGATDEERSRATGRALKLEGEAWQLLAERAFTDWSLWAQHDNVRLKQLLDREMPVPGLALADMLSGAGAVGDLARMRSLAELAVLDHARRLLALNAGRWCCAAFAPRPDRIDYLDLVESVAADNLIRHARFLIEIQGSPEAGLAYVSRIESAYKDHPQVTLARARAEAALARTAGGAQRDGYRRSAYANAMHAWLWEQGQTPTAADAYDVKSALGNDLGHVDNLFANDLPFRAFYSFWQSGGHVGYQLRNAHAALVNSTFDVAPVRHLQHLLVDIRKTPEEFEKVLQSIDGRFTGNPRLVQIRAKASLAKGDTAMAASLYRESVRINPSHWESYGALGRILFEDGRTAEAAKVFMSYPGFGKERTQNPVGIAGSAYEAGSLFFWSGALEHAKPLYRIAAELNTGSAASLSSSARLALMEGDLPQAAGYVLNRAQRYNSIHAYRDYLGVLHAAGHGREAWEGFGVLSRQLRGPQLWESALVGHRMEGFSERQVAGWLAGDLSRDPGWSSNYGAGHLLRVGVTDRTPSADLPSLVAEADFPVWKLDHGGGTVVRHVPGSTGLVVGPDAPAQGTILPIGVFERAKKERVQSDLAYFAEGYRAIRQGDYALATRRLLEATTLYDVRNVGVGYLLPYLGFAAARQGQIASVEKLLAGFSSEQRRFDYYLARAAISGLNGKLEQALTELKLALHRRPFTEGRPLFTEYQYAEICEWLFDVTRDRRFAALALSWAKANQAAQPWYAWPYAVEAKLATDPGDRKRAIAMAHYLDKGSERLSGIAGTDIETAVREFGGMNPFIASKEKQGT